MTSNSNEKTTKGDEDAGIPENLRKVLGDKGWYKTVIESMADGIIATDMNRTIAYVNPRITELLRYDEAELIGTSSLSIVLEEDRNRVVRETESRYKEKRSSQYEIRMRTKFGSAIPVMISATPILDDSGATIGTYALITDIRDRKVVEKELRSKNTELQTLYNNLLELYEQLGSIIAESTRISTEIYLFTSKECVYCAPAEEVLQEVLASYGGKLTYRKVDIDEEPELAEKYDIMSLPTIVIGEEQLTSVPDMYKLHSALFSALVPREKFRRTRQELDNIINYSPIAIFTINDEGVLTSMNPLLEMMTGFKRADIIGHNVINKLKKGSDKKVVKVFPKELVKLLKKGLRGENVSVNRLHIKDIDGANPESFSIISFKVVPMATEEGTINEILVLSEDVTTSALQEDALADSYQQLEELNDRLLQMNKQRTDFVEMTTTGLLEPLRNSNKLFDQILSGQLGKINDETYGTIEYLRNNLQNVSKSLIDILDYSTIETQGYNLHLSQLTLRELISEALTTVGSVVIDKGFIMMNEVSEDLMVWCDKEQVVRVLKNLILNAIKFADKDCVINVTAKKVKKGLIEISVQDNGIGIARGNLKRIFEQYVKLDPQSPGSGLGLAVVKNLVEAHHGTVVALSEGEGKGSLFKFTLPKDKKAFEKLASAADKN